MQLERALSLLPPQAIAPEKWILLNLVVCFGNNSKAQRQAGVSLRRVQQVSAKYKTFLRQINETGFALCRD